MAEDTAQTGEWSRTSSVATCEAPSRPLGRSHDRVPGRMEPPKLTLLLVYVAVVVTLVAVSTRRAIHGLTEVTKPALSVSTVTLESLPGVMCAPGDTGIRVTVVCLTSPLSLRLVDVSYTVQVTEHDQQISGLSRVQAIALLRDRGLDERMFALPLLGLGAYFHPGHDITVAAMAVPIARDLQRFDALLTVVDAAGRPTRITASVTDRRHIRPMIEAASSAREASHDVTE